MTGSYSRLDHPSNSSHSNERTRNILLTITAFITTFLVLSLSAHRNAPSSPSAQKVANYLPSLSSSPVDLDYSLDYRKQLELSTSPQSYLVHSPSLTFSKIYVLSLPTRQDRRQQIGKLVRALGLRVEFIDAVDKESDFFGWIAERVDETRKLRKKIIVRSISSLRSHLDLERDVLMSRTDWFVQAKARGVPQSSIGSNTIGGDWNSPYPNPATSLSPFPLYPLPPPSSPLRNQFSSTDSTNWVEHLEQMDSQNRLSELKPSKPNLNVTRLLKDPLERVKARQLTNGMMSTWWGQTRVMKRIIEDGDEKGALVLEDDVDIEWDLERLWASVERRLPENWDITYLGYCWGGENQSELN